MSVQLATLSEARESLIVVGTSCRKSLPVLQAYLTSIAAQELPPRVKLVPVFVPDWPTANTPEEQCLRAWASEHGGEVLRAGPTVAGDFVEGPVTHEWSLSAMQRVGAAKNRILRRALELNADAVWLADADLIMDRTTLASLWNTERPVACAVYWTHWQARTAETRVSHAGPQVWLRHPYELSGRGMDEAEFRAKLVKRELTRVWGQGACSLIRTPVLRAGVSFEHLQEPPLLQGLMAGEDRHFCIRAERAHVEMWADPWPDIFHVYHAVTDVPRIAAMAARLATPHPKRASFGDLVSVRLSALEPFPQPNGTFFRPAPSHVRGRLGALPLLPELEAAVTGLDRGASATVPVHVPLHYPNAYMRGRRRLIRVELLDCKPFGFAPVLDAEMLPSGADTATLTLAQLAGIKELA